MKQDCEITRKHQYTFSYDGLKISCDLLRLDRPFSVTASPYDLSVVIHLLWTLLKRDDVSTKGTMQKVITQHICLAIAPPCQGSGCVVKTDWYIILIGRELT